MPTFYLFRHGETYFSKTNTSYGDQIKSAPILEEGIPAVKEIGHFLEKTQVDACFSSPIKRCKQTVDILTKIIDKEFTYDERLSEWMDPNESMDSLRERLSSFLKDIENRGYKSVAICTHGACIAVIKHLVEDGKFEDDQIHDYPHTGVIWTV